MEHILSGTFGGVRYGNEWRREVIETYGTGADAVAEFFVAGYPRKFAGTGRQNLPKYQSETIFPDEIQGSRIPQIIDTFKKRANQASLTLVYATGHGLPGYFNLSNEFLPYDGLLDDLSKIPGKKVLLVLACHSGSILNILDRKEYRTDFSIITSAQDSQKSILQNDSLIHEKIMDNLANGRKLSRVVKDLNRLKFEHLLPVTCESQKPLSMLYFDVVL